MATSMFNTGNFPGSQQATIAKGFKKRFRDQSIIPWITNSEHKGEFLHQGTEIQIPILPVIHTYKVKPGDKVKYQNPKSSFEKFIINRERAWALHIEDEDKLFSRFDLESPILAEAAKRMAEDVEAEFLSDIIGGLKCHAKNCGTTAGFISGKYDLGTQAAPVKLIETGTAGSKQRLAPSYFCDLSDCMAEMPGAKDTQMTIVCHTAVGNRLHTSDLIKADWMGDSRSVLRGSVRGLGEIGGARIITDDKLPILTKTGANTNVYPILILNKQAISFVEAVAIRESNMKDIEYWGTFNRAKMIYDWFTIYPEFVGIGMVEL